MLPTDHSRIATHSRRFSSSHSDLHSLDNLRDLLPGHQPIAECADYLIESEADGSVVSGCSEEGRELMGKVCEQVHEIVRLREELFYYRTEFFRLAEENRRIADDAREAREARGVREEMEVRESEERAKARMREMQSKLLQQTQLREQSKKRCESLQRECGELRIEIQRLRAGRSQKYTARYQDELRCQQGVVMQLALKNQKVMRINAYLMEELRIAEGRLIDLQLEMQERTCGLLSENVFRLKENRNAGNNKNEEGDYPLRPTQSAQAGIGGVRLLQGPIDQRQTVKLTDRRESTGAEGRGRRVVVQRGREGLSPVEEGKLQPLRQPKPQRKQPRVIGVQVSKKFQRAGQLS